jgi:hypothetical protein
MFAAELEFGSGEQAIGDHVIAFDAVVDELAIAFGADDPERRQLALADAARKLDEHLPAVIERAKRPPRGIVALDAIAEVQRVDVDAGGHRSRRSMANASSKARIAASKLMPCLAQLSAALALSHSKSSFAIDTDNPYLGHVSPIGVARPDCLDQLQPPQARVPVLADDDVVVHRDAERLGDVGDRLRHLDVGARRRRIAGWVVVDDALNSIYLFEKQQIYSNPMTARGRCLGAVLRASA